tara:strand:- start:257 stop:370 length:114 start_codon:yes stop_codon:yes gene_type:complete
VDDGEVLWDFLSAVLEELHDNKIVTLEEAILVLGIEE